MEDDNASHSATSAKKEKYSEEDMLKINSDLAEFSTKSGIKVSSKIGQGGFSLVYMGNKDGRPFAVKLVYIREDDKGRTANMSKSEMIITGNLKNKNCVRSFGLYEFKHSRIIVLEFAVNRDLSFLVHLFYNKKLFHYLKADLTAPKFAFMNYMSESFMRFFVLQIVNALDYLRKMSFVHRDLKPENCLLTKNFQIRLSDFALSTSVPYNGDLKVSGAGTGVYMPPETFHPDKKAIPVKEAFKIDYYALGVLIFKMLLNQYTIKPNREGKIEYEVLSESLDEICNSDTFFLNSERCKFDKNAISKEMIDLVSKLINRDYTKRADLSDIMQHPWMKVKDDVIRSLYEFHDNDYSKMVIEMQKLDVIGGSEQYVGDSVGEKGTSSTKINKIDKIAPTPEVCNYHHVQVSDKVNLNEIINANANANFKRRPSVIAPKSLVIKNRRRT